MLYDEGWTVYILTDHVLAHYSIFTQTSLMAIQTNIPPDLTDADRTFIFQELDGELNSRILYALLHGLCVHLSRHRCLIMPAHRHIYGNHCCHTVDYM